MRGILALPIAVVGIAGLVGCLDPSGPQSVPCDPFLTAFGTVSGDTVTTEEGVRYVDVEAGAGATVGVGDFVEVNYSGYELSGDLFDSSCLEGRLPFQVFLGGTGAIEGFQIGIVGMSVGGVRRAIIPAELAYPEGTTFQDGSPHPLAGLDLIFDIELLERVSS